MSLSTVFFHFTDNSFLPGRNIIYYPPDTAKLSPRISYQESFCAHSPETAVELASASLSRFSLAAVAARDFSSSRYILSRVFLSIL